MGVEQGRQRFAASILVVLAVAATTVGGFAVAGGNAVSDVVSASGRLVGESSPQRAVGEPVVARTVGGVSVPSRMTGSPGEVVTVDQAVVADAVTIAENVEATAGDTAGPVADETVAADVAEGAVIEEPITTTTAEVPSESVVGPPLVTSVAPSSSVITATTTPPQPVVQIPVTQTPTTTAPQVPTTRAPIERDAPSANAATRLEGAPRTTTTAPPRTTTIAPTTVAPTTTTTTTTTTTSTTTTSTTTTTTTTTTPPKLSVVRVATNGNDANSGTTGSPVATLDRARQLVAEGGVIEYAAGTYAPLRLIGLNGVTIRGDGEVIFRGTGYSNEAGILIQGSRNIDIRGVSVNYSLWGIYVADSHRVTLRNNTVSDVGQEAIRVKDASSNVVIDGNTVANTGRRSSTANGEGIYVGTGSPGGVDRVSNVSITNNSISNTTDEAIDIKDATTNIEIRGNTISNIVTRTTGAIVVHVNSTSSSNPNITIEQNIISGVRRASEFRDGNCIVTHTTTRIVNNVLHNCEHRGIHLAGSAGQATVLHNTLINAGSIGAIVDDGRGMNVISQNNLGASGDANKQADSSHFPGASSGNYRLASSSKAEFANAPSVGVSTDLFGSGRSGSGSITYGAIE